MSNYLPDLSEEKINPTLESIKSERRNRKDRKKNRAASKGLTNQAAEGEGEGLAAAVTKSDLSLTDQIFCLIDKMKQLRELKYKGITIMKESVDKLLPHICVLDKLQIVLKQHGLEDGLESELSSTITLCDEAIKDYQHLDDPLNEYEMTFFYCQSYLTLQQFSMEYNITRRGHANKKIRHLLTALQELYDLIPTLVYVSSEETTLGNSGTGLRKLGIEIDLAHDPERMPSLLYKGKRLSTLVEDREVNMIDIKSTEKFLKHLAIARISHTPVVILFCSKHIIRSKEFLPHFDDLRNQYLQFRGDPIKFFRVEAKKAFRVFKIKTFPTVVVMRMSLGRLIEYGRVSIDETIIVPGFVMGLKKLLDELGEERY